MDQNRPPPGPVRCSCLTHVSLYAPEDPATLATSSHIYSPTSFSHPTTTNPAPIYQQHEYNALPPAYQWPQSIQQIPPQASRTPLIPQIPPVTKVEPPFSPPAHRIQPKAEPKTQPPRIPSPQMDHRTSPSPPIERTREQFSPPSFASEKAEPLKKPETVAKTGVKRHQPPAYVPTPINKLAKATAPGYIFTPIDKLGKATAPGPVKKPKRIEPKPKSVDNGAEDLIGDILNLASHSNSTAAAAAGSHKSASLEAKKRKTSSTTSMTSSSASSKPAKAPHHIPPAPKQHQEFHSKPAEERRVHPKLTEKLSKKPPEAFHIPIKEKKRKSDAASNSDSSDSLIISSKWLSKNLEAEKTKAKREGHREYSKASSSKEVNENIKAIADLNQKIAEKEREMASGGKYKAPIWRAYEPVNPKLGTERQSSTPKTPTFDINSLFEDDDFIGSSDGESSEKDKEDMVQVKPPKPAQPKAQSPPLVDLTRPKPLQQSKQQSIMNYLGKESKFGHRKIPSATEQMKRRFEQMDQQAREKPSTSSAGSSKMTQSKLTPASFGKGEGRVARANQSPLLDPKRLVPLDMCNKKFALGTRVRYLQRLYDEYAKIQSCSAEEAIESAKQEEKSIVDKTSTKVGYASAMAATVKRIRECVREGTGRRNSTEAVSHFDVLAGKHTGTFSVGLQRTKRDHRNDHISENDFYALLSQKFLLDKEQLYVNGFPLWLDEQTKALVVIKPPDEPTTRIKYVQDENMKRICSRCGAEYRLTKEGNYLGEDNSCVYHWGKAWKKRINGTVDSRYTCCDQDLSIKGCTMVDFHVTEAQKQSVLRKFVETPKPVGAGDPRSGKVYAMDCEMVYGVWGPMLARVSVVDIMDELVLDELVRPDESNPVVDGNTRFSGLTKAQLEKATHNFEGVRERFFELVNSETILIGHSLESDLKSMRIVHRRVVDTSVVFPHRLGPPKKRALKTLTSEILQKIIQEDETGHDSKEDASACMKLMLHKIRG